MKGIDTLKAQPLLNYIKKQIDFSDEDESILCSKISARKYRKGQYIVQAGDICRHEYFILSGCTRTYHLDEEGLEHIVLFAIEDWWTTDMGSFISKSPADFNVQCVEDTEVIQFSYEAIEELYIQIPQMERFFRKIIERAYVASQKRIIRSFSLPAKERYLIFKDNYPKIEQRIPQYMVASYLGITKEFLSKIKSQLILEQ